MTKKFSRIPKNYDGNQPTGRAIQGFLPQILEKLRQKKPSLEMAVFEAFNSALGSKMSSLATPLKFEEGTLFVKVKTSAMLSVMRQYEEVRVLSQIKKALPNVIIQRIMCSL
jgi:hypothetical protein